MFDRTKLIPSFSILPHPSLPSVGISQALHIPGAMLHPSKTIQKGMLYLMEFTGYWGSNPQPFSYWLCDLGKLFNIKEPQFPYLQYWVL